MIIKYNNFLILQEKGPKILRPKTLGLLLYLDYIYYPNAIFDGQYDFDYKEMHTDIYFICNYNNVWNQSFIKLVTNIPHKISVLNYKTHNGLWYGKKYINFFNYVEKYIKYHVDKI